MEPTIIPLDAPGCKACAICAACVVCGSAAMMLSAAFGLTGLL